MGDPLSLTVRVALSDAIDVALTVTPVVAERRPDAVKVAVVRGDTVSPADAHEETLIVCDERGVAVGIPVAVIVRTAVVEMLTVTEGVPCVDAVTVAVPDTEL